MSGRIPDAVLRDRRGRIAGCRTNRRKPMSALPLRTLFETPRSSAPLPVSQLGRAFRVKGTLDSEGELRVEGTVYGRINAVSLVVGAEGYVEGDIVARDVRIAGRFNGRIFALNVAIDASADVSGRIFHHSIEVAKGARIDGRMPWRPPNYFDSLEQLPETRA